MPSLKDLAKECGVSVATVSKALNDQPDISPATRERVRAAAHRMGYMPNAAARSLKTNRTYNLGVLFVDERQSGLTHEYFSAVLDSFKVEAEKHGYDITFINHNISGSTITMLRASSASHLLVIFGSPVTTVNDNGFSELIANILQYGWKIRVNQNNVTPIITGKLFYLKRGSQLFITFKRFTINPSFILHNNPPYTLLSLQ